MIEMLGGIKNMEGGFLPEGEIRETMAKEDRVGLPGRQKEGFMERRGCPGVQAPTLESCPHCHVVRLITVTSATVT